MVTLEEIAEYAFMAFVVIAVVAGLAIGYSVWDATEDDDFERLEDLRENTAYITLVMLILGVIVGVVSITAKEVRPFLIAAIALMVVGVGAGITIQTPMGEVGGGVWSPFLAVESLEVLYYLATYILNFIVAFASPAAVIIAIRSLWAIAKEK